MNSSKINFDNLIDRIKQYNVVNIQLEESTLNLTIKVEKNNIINEIEQDIKQKFLEYEVKILFLIEENKIKAFKKIIGISSGKGGVGKSMTALNLSFCLRDMGKKVGILDADAYSPSIAGLLNVSGPPKTLDGNLIEPVLTHGLEMLSIGLFLKDGESQVWQEGMISAIFSQFMVQTNWKSEYLIIDFAGGMNDAYNACLKVCPDIELIMISQPNKMVYRDVIRMYTLIKAMNIKVIGFVENMTTEFYPEESLKEFDINLKHINRLCTLPFFNCYKNLIESGYPVDYVQTEEKQAFENLIDRII